MVASDQNQVFDTGDPSGHPTPVFDQQRQAELVKMQDFLLSQKREEIFGKKRKKKDKKHSKKIVKLNPSNNLPQSTANHTAESAGGCGASTAPQIVAPSLEEPRPPRKKVKKAESLLGVSAELPIPNTSNNDSNNETVNSPPKKKIPKAGTSAETVALNAEINAAAQNGNANGNAAGITAEITKKCSPPKKKANKVTELASTSSSAAENGSAGGGCGTSTAPQIAETSNGNNAKINAEPIESRPPKRLFKSRQWDEDPLPVSAEEPALGNVTLKQCFKCFDSKTENQLIQHLLDKHGIKGKICYDCQLVFRRLKNHKCPHQQQSNTTSNGIF